MGHSAGSVKGKPKIEVYDKDRKKGSGGLITPAKVWSIVIQFSSVSLVFLNLNFLCHPRQTYNPAADSILGLTESLTEKDKDESVPSLKKQAGADVPIAADKEQKKKKKRNQLEASEPIANDGTEPEDEVAGKKEKKKKKKHLVDDAEEPEGEAVGRKEKKKKKKHLDETEIPNEDENDGEGKKKKKRKHADVEGEGEGDQTSGKKKEKKKKKKSQD